MGSVEIFVSDWMEILRTDSNKPYLQKATALADFDKNEFVHPVVHEQQLLMHQLVDSWVNPFHYYRPHYFILVLTLTYGSNLE